MFKKDIDLVQRLHSSYGFIPPLLDAGGLERPVIADYEISIKKAHEVEFIDQEGNRRHVRIPHSIQHDRYVKIKKPWSFIDENYIILNPEYSHPPIEELSPEFHNRFNTVIMVSVFEHVSNPYIVSDALFRLLQPGGFLINSTPFLFPYHPSPEDNFRFSPLALKRIHEQSGFQWLEGDFHINYSSDQGIGDVNPKSYGAPQAIMASYALCRKPINR